MTTSQGTPKGRVARRMAQAAVLLGALCTIVALFWNNGLTSFLLALIGLIVTVAGVSLAPDGWLVDPEEGE